MTREVLLTVTGGQTGEDGLTEKNMTVNSALYERRGRVHMVSFTEVDPESGGKTESVIRFSEKAVVISRNGEVRTGMRLIPGRITDCRYETPYGVLDMRVDTRQITLLQSEDVLEVSAEYDLEIGGSAPVRSKVIIVVESPDRR